MERTNLRYLPGLPQKVDVVTLDLSFISILKVSLLLFILFPGTFYKPQSFETKAYEQVMPAVMNVMKEDATLVTLVKPQFEARRSQVINLLILRCQISDTLKLREEHTDMYNI